VLRAAILDGTVPAGGQLREAHVAAGLEISRSPLREALTRLEEEGLIVKIPFRGAIVVEVSARDVAEFASVRLLRRAVCAELSAEALRGPEWPGADGSH
jgi:DNA-binding GntR family transcriptional regulator